MANALSESDIQKLPSRLQWAIRAIRAYPYTSELSVCSDPEDSEVVHVRFKARTELPGRWRSESPSGVRRYESVLFIFELNFPRKAPVVYLRADFDRSHPHLQPSLPNSLPEPCLVYGSPRELIQARGGINALLDQLALWLERAAFVKLIDPVYGWEPTRRDNIRSIVVVNSSDLLGRINKRGGCDCFQTDLFWDSSEEQPARWSYVDVTKQLQITRSGLKSIGSFATKAPFVHKRSLTFFAWPGSTVDGIPKVDGVYTPETVHTVHEMFERAKLFGCQIDLKIQLRKYRSLLGSLVYTVAVPIIIILVARRPYDLIGTLTPYELCPYLVLVQKGSELLPNSNTSVIPLGHRNTISQEVLRKTSGSFDNREQSTWTSVGCGSVGSKLSMHLARQGNGPSVVVDNGYLEPHNYARHSALPLNSKLERMFFRQKSKQLALDIGALAQHVDSYHKDVVDLLGSSEKTDIISKQTGRYLVNSTGSLVVREVLANEEWKKQDSRPSVIECCLMGAGAVGYFSVEGADGCPNSTDLVAEFYSALQNQPNIASRVFGVSTDIISVGQGCGSQSFIISDAKISQHVAPFAKILNGILSSPEETVNSYIQYQVLDNDGIGIQSYKIKIDPPIIIPANVDGKPTTRLSAQVAKSIDEQIKYMPGRETGGVLIGRYSAIGHAFHVTDTIAAPIDSKSSPELFVLGTSGLKDRIKTISELTGGALYVLGTWHNHLSVNGPSAIDQISAQIMAKSQNFPLLMLIHTPDGYITVSPNPNEC